MDVTYAALQRLHRAVKTLAQWTEQHETKQKITLFEASPTNDDRALAAWKELNDAQADAARALNLESEGENNYHLSIPSQGMIESSELASMLMDHSESDKRVKIVHDLIPSDWNSAPLSLAHELRELLKPIVDQDTSIDSGGGDGIADLWPKIGGIEYHVQITAKK